MFDLAKKVADAMNLSDLFVKAQTVLRDYQGDKVLSNEETAAFSTELSEVVKAFIEKDDFKVSAVYTLTDEQKLEAIEVARNEEKATAASAKEEFEKTISVLETEKTTVSAELETSNSKIKELTEAEENKAVEAKIDDYMKSFNSDGIELTPVMAKTFRTVIASIVGNDDEEEKVKELKKELKASVKQAELADGSQTLGDVTSGGDTDDGSLKNKLEKLQKEYTD